MTNVPPPPPPPDPNVGTPGAPIPPPAPPGYVAYSPAAAGSRQLGTPRSKALVILLTIVTLGIWTIVWSYQNGNELKRYSGQGIGGGGYLGIMLANLLVGPIPAIVVMFLLASEVEQLYRREGLEPRITTIWGLWFLLPIIGNIIWYVRIQNALNHFWRTHGSTQPAGV